MEIKNWEGSQEQQAYKALQKWATRLNKMAFDRQWKANKKKKLKTFCPNSFALELTDACGKLLNETITAEEAMSLLHTVEGKTELRLCMEAGF
jgi:hypothetical protein